MTASACVAAFTRRHMAWAGAGVRAALLGLRGGLTALPARISLCSKIHPRACIASHTLVVHLELRPGSRLAVVRVPCQDMTVRTVWCVCVRACVRARTCMCMPACVCGRVHLCAHACTLSLWLRACVCESGGDETWRLDCGNCATVMQACDCAT
eukprot:11228364-Lingulodinium_polyedra.AAC.3